MEFLTWVFLIYSFIAFYFLFLFLLLYIQNRKDFFSYPKFEKQYSLSIVIPCYNEEEHIGETIHSLLNSGYKGLKKIIVVDDCSTDNSFEIIKKFAAKYPKVMAVQTPKNTGNAAGAKNYGARFVETELIGFTDADSYPEKNSINKVVGFFNEPRVGAVTSSIFVKNRNKFIEKLQVVEYKVITFTRKFLECLDAVHVTPGPLAIYRKTAFDDVGRFDEKNLTEDIDITWHLQVKGWKVKMSIPSHVYTVAPDNIKDWIKQRNRWNIGGLQTINKYKRYFLRKSGMLGNFIMPFFVLSWVTGLVGISILFYRLFRTLIFNFLSAKYSIGAQVALLTLRDINLTPNVLIFFGLAIFVMGLSFTLIVLATTREKGEKGYKQTNVLTLAFYTIFYLLAYPLLLVFSIYKFLKREISW